MDYSEMPKKRMCKAVRLSIIAEQLGIKVPGSTNKKTPSTKKAFPKRIAELNFSNDSTPTKLRKKTNARKQLWSVDKHPRTRRISMKPNNGNIRKTICGKQSTFLKGNAKSVNQTLPLVDLEQYDTNSILYEKLIVSQRKVKFNIAAPKNIVSKTNFAKPGTSQNITKLGTSRNTAKPGTSQNTAKPVANFSFAKPVAKLNIERFNSSKSLKEPPSCISKIPQPERKMESSKTDQMLEKILKYIIKLSEQVNTINNRLDTVETFIKQQALLNKTNEISNTTDDMTKNRTMKSVKKCLFNFVSSGPKENEEWDSKITIIKNDYIRKDMKGTSSNNDLLIANVQDKRTEKKITPSKDSIPKNDNNSDTTNNLETKEIDNNLLKTTEDKEAEKLNNNVEESPLKSNSKVKVVEDCSEFQEHLKLINEVHHKILTDETNKMIKKSESKETSNTTSKFELLEQQLKNGLVSDSTSIISSDPNSPFVGMGIEELISNNVFYDDASEETTNVIKKCDQIQSASINIPHVSTPTDNLSEIEKSYYQMKDNLQFLCTPIVKKTVTVVTSTKLPNSHRKILSRRVQEQLFLLNDF